MIVTHHVDFQKLFRLVVKQSQVVDLLKLKYTGNKHLNRNKS